MIKDPKAYASELLDWYGGADLGRLAATQAFMKEVRTAKPRLPMKWAVAVIHELTREEVEAE